MTVVGIASFQQFESIINDQYIDLVLIFFTSPITGQCQQMRDILTELDEDKVMYNRVILEVPSEEMISLSQKYQVKVAPTVIFVRGGFEFDRVEGFDTFELVSKMSDLVGSEDIDLRLDGFFSQLLSQTRIVVLVDSDQQKKVISHSLDVLGLTHVSSFVELSPLQIAFLLKSGKLSGGTPQILRDGVSIVELESLDSNYVDKQLENLLVMSIDHRLRELIGSSKVMLFMKGTPKQPRCGFSRKMVEMLESREIDFGYFDILGDEQVRSELKRYSNWPTYPQLYVNSELIGGLDVVKELVESKEFLID